MKDVSELKLLETYCQFRETVITAQSNITVVINIAMVHVYWEIREKIYLACNKNKCADYE